MSHSFISRTLVFLAFGFFVWPAAAQSLVVEGVSDRVVYPDTVSFRVPTSAGFTYSVLLDNSPAPAGEFVRVDAVDYHELRVSRTPTGGGATTNRLIRFIVRATERATTEVGVPPNRPLPPVTSATNEFVGAILRLLAPQIYPRGLEIPVAATVENTAGHAVRVNGLVSSPGHPSFQIRRGWGSGWLGSNHVAGPLNYVANIQGLATNKLIELEAATTWTTIPGTLSGNISWPAGSRVHISTDTTIPAGSTLTIGAGTIVRLDAGVTITLDGSLIVNGTVDQPVVFTPNSRAQPWGGFLLRNNTSEITAQGTIFTGSGADPTWITNNGYDSHRKEQCLFFLENSPRVTLTDCAMFDLAGQLGHSINGGAITMTRCLVQRLTTGGEFTGASFRVNDSAFIECPVDSAAFVDGDNDGLYITSGSHGFTNTLFGWTKDDAIDAGGSGAGLLEMESCWFEATFHEGMALSGTAKIVNVHNTVFLGCSQGLEVGYDGPRATLDNSLAIANKTGFRFGDNYDWSYTGFLRATNSISIYNHRDLWGRTWNTSGSGFNTNQWVERTNQMDLRDNLITAPNSIHPLNQVWNPAQDGWRLAALQTAPIGRVGVAFATRPGPISPAVLRDGLPVALSSFCTNIVTVTLETEYSDGTSTSSTLEFLPGQERKYLPLPNIRGVSRFRLVDAQNADLTGNAELFMQTVGSATASNTTLVATGAVWKYLDDGSNQGTAWKELVVNDADWLSGPAELGYGDGDEATVVRSNRVNGTRIVTTYFRRAFSVDNPEAYERLLLDVRRDDGVVVYLNGSEIFRSNMGGTPGTPVAFDAYALGSIPNGDEVLFFSANTNATLLRSGVNVVAAEIHQPNLTSSDITFELRLVATPRTSNDRVHVGRLGDDVVTYWFDSTFGLEEADEITGPWRNVSTNSPAITTPLDQRFFRLRR